MNDLIRENCREKEENEDPKEADPEPQETLSNSLENKIWMYLQIQRQKQQNIEEEDRLLKRMNGEWVAADPVKMENIEKDFRSKRIILRYFEGRFGVLAHSKRTGKEIDSEQGLRARGLPPLVLGIGLAVRQKEQRNQQPGNLPNHHQKARENRLEKLLQTQKTFLQNQEPQVHESEHHTCPNSQNKKEKILRFDSQRIVQKVLEHVLESGVDGPNDEGDLGVG